MRLLKWAGWTALVTALLCGPTVWNLRGIPHVPTPPQAEEFANATVLEEDNAARLYEQAFDRFVPRSDEMKEQIDDLSNAIDAAIDWKHAEPLLKTWLDENTDALNLWREGTERPEFLTKWHQQGLAFSVAVQPSLDIVRLAHLKSFQQLSLGKVDESLKWQCATFRFTSHLPSGGTTLDHTMSHGSHWTACWRLVLWASNPSVQAPHLVKAAAAVEAAFAESNKEERIICDYFSEQNSLAVLDEMRDSENDLINFRQDIGHRIRRAYLGEDLLAARLLNVQTARRLAAAQSPEKWRRTATEYLFYEPVDTTTHVKPTTKQFVAACNRLPFALNVLEKENWEVRYENSKKRLESRKAMLQAVLAAEIYRRDHGLYPASLQQCVANGYLATIPIDPQAAQPSAIGYRAEPDCQSATVWTVGPNGTDDNGDLDHKPAAGPPDYGYHLRPIDLHK